MKFKKYVLTKRLDLYCCNNMKMYLKVLRRNKNNILLIF